MTGRHSCALFFINPVGMEYTFSITSTPAEVPWLASPRSPFEVVVILFIGKPPNGRNSDVWTDLLQGCFSEAVPQCGWLFSSPAHSFSFLKEVSFGSSVVSFPGPRFVERYDLGVSLFFST